MIKTIFHLSDIHIPMYSGLEKYKECLNIVIEDIREQIKSRKLKSDETRICLLGDIYHNKVSITPEQIEVVGWFFRELSTICSVSVVCGNHDLLENNKSRQDSISPVVRMLNLPNLHYLDMELGYKSGCVVDDNIVWCLHSIFDKYERPDIEKSKNENPNLLHVGIIHAALIGSKTDLGFTMNHGFNMDMFFNVDFVIAGDIHLGQELTNDEGIKLVYPSSPLQNSYGEKINGHGYVIWDVESQTYEKINIENDYGFYKFSIDNIDAIKNNEEKIGNL